MLTVIRRRHDYWIPGIGTITLTNRRQLLTLARQMNRHTILIWHNNHLISAWSIAEGTP